MLLARVIGALYFNRSLLCYWLKQKQFKLNFGKVYGNYFDIEIDKVYWFEMRQFTTGLQ